MGKRKKKSHKAQNNCISYCVMRVSAINPFMRSLPHKRTNTRSIVISPPFYINMEKREDGEASRKSRFQVCPLGVARDLPLETIYVFPSSGRYPDAPAGGASCTCFTFYGAFQAGWGGMGVCYTVVCLHWEINCLFIVVCVYFSVFMIFPHIFCTYRVILSFLCCPGIDKKGLFLSQDARSALLFVSTCSPFSEIISWFIYMVWFCSLLLLLLLLLLTQFPCRDL